MEFEIDCKEDRNKRKKTVLSHTSITGFFIY